MIWLCDGGGTHKDRQDAINYFNGLGKGIAWDVKGLSGDYVYGKLMELFYQKAVKAVGVGGLVVVEDDGEVEDRMDVDDGKREALDHDGDVVVKKARNGEAMVVDLDVDGKEEEEEVAVDASKEEMERVRRQDSVFRR